MLAINAQGLKVALGGRLVLADVSFQVKLGELAAIVGPNGAGKTTLLKVLLGLLPPVEGRLEFFGTPAGGENRKLLGYLPQNSQFDRNFPMTVADVVQMGQGSWSFFYRPEASVEEETRRCLKQVGLAGWEKRLMGELSGGQQQLVFLARALNGLPRLVLLDEPTTGLDVLAKNRFYHLLGQLKKELGLTVLVVSHDLESIKANADRVIVLSAGRVLAQGAPRELLADGNRGTTLFHSLTMMPGGVH